ncbi:helix-turn-helix protein [Diaminobutyricimonas aerilata]|uniref:Helix-turn-helix protein n=1 Tax=Diaminobutyricimonas aerilata TaxID=1162967 RepID=A0A2M9CP31_9MICO|nr:helix-turn-helix transcriptional regulator [Diaminobutyricimonas aerilata]PJJ73644.1 helix-turn-helix protein [Diaminobutyricimonas aerilata]
MSEFATVLRSWRDRVSPEDVGLPAGPGRRAAGLRREEVAALAGVSVDYIVRLEQGRAENPSPQLLGALARALRLTEQERDHLYRAAGVAPPSSGMVPRHITPGVQRILDRLGDVPMLVFTATWDVLQLNALAAALSDEWTRYRGIERNVAWRHFTIGHDQVTFDEAHHEEFSSDLVGDLRTAVGRYPADPHLAELVSRLRDVSPDFARRWSSAHLAQHRTSRKTFATTVGPITMDCDVLAVPDNDLRIVVYTVAPGSVDEERLALLRVTGTQQLAAPVVAQ